MTKKWVFYHDDFDGLASAAILTLVAKRNLEQFTHYKSVDYSADLDWNTELPCGVDGGDDFSVVDFHFHPYAWYWADHHLNPFRYPFFSDLYDARKIMDDWRVLWDDTESSCAGLLYRTHFPDFVDPNGRLAPLVKAADMIDTAGYPSAQSYFEAKDLPVRMVHGHSLMTEGQKSEVIRRFAGGTIEDAYDVVREPCEQGVERARWARDRNGERAELEGSVVVTDLVNQQVPYSRYAAFYYFPNALYQAAVYSIGNGVGLTLSKNPWIQFDHLNLRDLVALVGGGGHSFAAAAQFGTDFAYANALIALRKWVSALNSPLAEKAA